MGLNLNLNINGAKRGLATPPIPTDVVITVVSDTEFSIAYVSAFSVEFWYSTDNVTYTKHGDSASTPYAMTGLTAGTLYWVKPRAVNGSKFSAFGSASSAITNIIDYSKLSFLGGSIDFENNLWIDESGNNNDILFKNASARTSISGNLDYTITGLLETDTIEVISGSDTPIISAPDTLRIGEGDVVYGVTIKRSGVVWAIIPFCEPIYNLIIPTTSYDVSGNGHHATCATLTSDNIDTQDNYFYLLEHGYNYYKNSYTNNFSVGVDGWVAGWGTSGAGTVASDGEKVNFEVTSQPSSSATTRPSWTRNNTLTIGVKTRLIVKGSGIFSAYSIGTFVNIIDVDLSLQDYILEGIPTSETIILYFNGSARSSFYVTDVIIDEYRIVPGIDNKDVLGNELNVIQDGNKWLEYTSDLQIPVVINNPKLSTILISGLCVSGKTYFIEKTEIDHFGSDKILGDTFVSDGTEILNINNQVREVLSAYFFSDGTDSVVKTFEDFKNWRPHLYYNKQDVWYYDKGGYLITSLRLSELIIFNDNEFIGNEQHLILNNYYSLNQYIDFPLFGFSWDHSTYAEAQNIISYFGDLKQTYFMNYSGNLTNAEVVLLSQLGHEIGFHTWWKEEIDNYPNERKGFYETSAIYTESELIDYWTKSLQYYNNVLGYTLESKAFPGGQADLLTHSISGNFFKYRRGTGATLQINNINRIPNDFHYIPSQEIDTPKYTDITSYIDTMITNGYSFFSLYGHPAYWDGTKYNATGIVDASGKTQLEWMADILTYIRTKQNAGTEVRVVTLKQIYDIVNQLI